MLEKRKRLQEAKEYLISEKAKRDALIKQNEKLSGDIGKIKNEQGNIALERAIIIKASDEARESGKNLITSLCNSVVGEIELNSEVIIENAIKYSSPTMDIYIQRDDGNGNITTTDPAQEDAGGIADLMSLAIQASLLKINESNSAPLFLDEPTKFVSKNNAEIAAKLIKEISKSVGRQVFVVTHEKDVMPQYADKHYEISKNADGISEIRID